MSLRHLMRLVETAAQPPSHYMHVTALKNVASIMKRGLLPNHKRNYHDDQWIALDGIYASRDARQLHSYMVAHGIQNYGVVIVEVSAGSALPDEDIININMDFAIEKALKRDGRDIEEVLEEVWDNGGEIDFTNPFWAEVKSTFLRLAGEPVAAADAEKLIDFGVAILYHDGGDALLSWPQMKDEFCRAHPHMVNAHTGDQHSVRIPGAVGFEGPTRIVGIVSVRGHSHKVEYDQISQNREEINELVGDLLDKHDEVF